jgi:DNA sulfur modification protein DndC
MLEADLFADQEGSCAEQLHQQAPPHERALRSIERVLLAGHPCLLSYSSGKDSSSCANLLLNAAINVIQAGHPCPPLLVSHVDTTVESPVVRALADAELAKIQRFAQAHGIPLAIKVGRPNLAACFATRILGGRALPPFPTTGVRDCSTDWKIVVSERNIRSFIPDGSAMPVVTIIGTRSSESQARAINTAARKETAHQLWFNDDGDARLSPILDWDTDDVWTYLGEAAAGEHLAYSDFAELMDFYRDAGASSCVIVADMKSAASSKPCSSRSGCWSCTAVQNDRSVENMIQENPAKYPYLVPLLELRNFLADTQFDFSRRNFIGRSISPEGRIKVKADQYSPAMVEDLLRYTLAAQDRANELGAPARVQPVGLRELVCVDFYWSLRAWHPPFHALWIYLDHIAGNRQYAPKVSRPYPPSPAPVIGEIEVGGDWDEQWSALYPSGLRYPAWELFSDSCGPALRSNKAGKVFLELGETPEMDVDEEAAADFIEFIAEEKIAMYHRHDCHDYTIGAMTYLQYGTVTIGSGSSSMIDSIMRRSQWLQQHGLHGHQTAESLRARCSSLVEQQAELFA